MLRLSGRAQVQRGLPKMSVMARFAARYYVAPAGLRSEISHARLWTLRNAYYGQSEAVYISIVPGTAEVLDVPAEASVS